MPFPASFYNKKQKYVEQYNDFPPGEFDVNQLTISEPCWLNSELEEELKPKILVMADWTAPSWTAEKRAQVNSALGKAIDEKFKILICQNQSFVFLPTKSLIKKLDYDLVEWIDSKIIISEILNITHITKSEDILILDSCRIDLMLTSLNLSTHKLKEYINKPKTLLSSEFPCTTDSYSRKIEDFEFIRTSQEQSGLSHIIHNQFATHVNERIKNIKTKYKRIISDIEILWLDGNQFTEFLEKKEIIDNDVIFREKDLKNIKELEIFYGKLSLDDISEITKKAPQLQTLGLTRVKIITSGLALPSLIGENIEHIEFENCDIHSVDVLNQFISQKSALPKLKKVTFSYTSKYNATCISFLTQKPTIEEISLKLEGSQIPYLSQITELLSMAPKLKKLYISFTKLNDNYTILFNLPLLESLEELIIDYRSPKNLFHLTQSTSDVTLTPNLKKVVLTFGTFSCLNDVLPYKNVEELNLRSTFVSESAFNFSMLSIMAPTLKKITLECNIQIDSDLDLNFPELEEIDFINKKFKLDQIKWILSHSPKLKRIFADGKDILNLLNFYDLPPSIELIYLTKIAIRTNKENDQADQKSITQNNENKRETPEADFIHNPEDTIDFKPETGSFQFKGIKDSKDQKMFIEKISQFWSLRRQENLARIPKIQNGICAVLSGLFIDEHENWDRLTQLLQYWDGTEETLTKERVSALDFLTKNIIEYYNNKSKNYYFVGTQLDELLKDKKSHVICTPWHAIAVVPDISTTKTKIYDPNFKKGYKIRENNKVTETVRTYLESAVTMILTLPDDKCSHIKASLPNPGLFIQKGGLLVLNQVVNKKDLLEILYNIETPFTKEELHGILLRATGGEPAWALAINNPVLCDYSSKLLLQFINAYGDDAIPKLEKSLENLPFAEQQKFSVYLDEVFKLGQIKSTKISELTNKLNTQSKKEHYKKQLETWKSDIQEPSTLLAYSQYLVSREADIKKILVQFNSSDDVNSMQRALRKNTKRPFFYINTPRDLKCSANWIQEGQNNIGKIKVGPGGLLYDFIQENMDKDPIIYVNYANFKESDIIKLNGLLDKLPHADGTNLPKNTCIIGLQDINSPSCYKGSDFYGRFDKIETPGISSEELKPKPLPFAEKNKDEKTARINLYNASNWKELLLGTWKIKKDVNNKNYLMYEEGSLISALESKKPLEIKNGLWENTEFCNFWQDAVEMGYIKCGKRKIVIPKDLKIIKTKGYNNFLRKKHINYSQGLIFNAPVLNPSLYSQLFVRYECDEKKVFNSMDGLIKANAGKTLEINLTRSLSEDQWGRVVEECSKYNVTLNVHYSSSTVESKNHSDVTQIITSNDLDAAVKKITQESKEEWQVVDISECEGSSLLIHTLPLWNDSEEFYLFEQTEKFLLKSLRSGKNVILKGNFKPQLIDALAPLLFERLDNKGS